MNNITYPEVLRDKETKIYQYYNGDNNDFSISVSVLSGYLKIYVNTIPEVSSTSYVETF